jgi:hypothetical protein
MSMGGRKAGTGSLIDMSEHETDDLRTGKERIVPRRCRDRPCTRETTSLSQRQQHRLWILNPPRCSALHGKGYHVVHCGCCRCTSSGIPLVRSGSVHQCRRAVVGRQPSDFPRSLPRCNKRIASGIRRASNRNGQKNKDGIRRKHLGRGETGTQQRAHELSHGTRAAGRHSCSRVFC